MARRANTKLTFVRFVLVWICRFPLPLGVWERLRFVIVALPGLFSYPFFSYTKLKAADVEREILKWLTNYLAKRKQRVILPGVISDWIFILAGVPQGYILGLILFLIYINDIVAESDFNIRLFADNTSFYIMVDNPITSAVCLNSDLSIFFYLGK